MSDDKRPLSIAEVFELTPGTDDTPTWVNGGFTGMVKELKATQTKKGQAMNIAKLMDQTGGSAYIGITVFGPVQFKEGDVIEVMGNGLRRIEYKGRQEVALSKNAKILVVGRSVHHEEQKQRSDQMQPAMDGSAWRPAGQTVGMAMNQAIRLVADGWGPELPSVLDVKDPAFWAAVHAVASDIIRVSHQLEIGNLAPSAKKRAEAASKAPSRASGGQGDTSGTPQGSQAQQGGRPPAPTVDEDVPF